MPPATKSAKPAKAKAPATPKNPKTTTKGNGATPTIVRGMSKTAIYEALAQKVGITRKECAAVIDGLYDLICQELGKSGPGLITLPGLFKLKMVHKPAMKARTGIDPFTKKERTFKAREAKTVFKALPLKVLKVGLSV